MNARKPVMPVTWVDPDDAPELTDAFFERADLHDGQKLVRRGRPALAEPRPMLSMRVDADLLAHLRASGKGWQTRVHALLKEAARAGRV